jgi:uncharacterized damage-inducible protein DinB
MSPPLDSIRRQARYDVWANGRFAAVLSDAHERPLRLLAHAATSERVWLGRIRGTHLTSTTADFWPVVDAAGCRALIERAAEDLGDFVGGLTEAGLAAEAVYRNSSGTEYRTPVHDVLTHVFFHSHYHRGQAAAALRALDVDPPWTDFIVFAREGG